MIYITGDTHGNWRRFSTSSFIPQKEMTRDDFVIVCGDFGIWTDDKEERYWLNWLSEKPFTLLFVDGNHENFDRLNSEFKEVDFHGGRAHKIRDNIYHLMRGYVFDLCGKKFFTFGGASSHDISDGILDEEDFDSYRDFIEAYKSWDRQGKMFRANHYTWWKEELPDQEEMDRGIENLNKVNYKVDYVITHCLPQSIATLISCGEYKPDILTKYFDDLLDNGLEFKSWYCGHYHRFESIFAQYNILYEQIVRIV